MGSTNARGAQLLYICSLFAAVNKSCREMKGITYTSGEPTKDRVLTPFQVFLCKLAQICDTTKGGDTITALVALKAADGPAYVFASNNRKDIELENTKKFLSDLLGFVGTNPDGLAERALQKKVLWRILEFNFSRVDYYLKRIVASIGECIAQRDYFISHNWSDTARDLQELESKAKFSRDMLSGNNAKNKFLSDCETLIKAIHFARENGLSEAINERAGAGEFDGSHPWCELRHYLGRLHSYRQATECIVRASKEWPELFTGFSIRYIPSSRSTRLSLQQPPPSPLQVIHAAFPDMELEEYQSHIEKLQKHHLNRYIQEELRQKSVRQSVHCEVHLQDSLVHEGSLGPSEYWNNTMFVATSKPPCRLCHYYFSDPDNDFQVQSSHMNVYPKWRLPGIYEGQGEDAEIRRIDLLEDIIEQMQQDTLRLVKEQLPQGKRNDSRTESRGLSTAIGHDYVERSDTRNSSGLFSMSGRSGRGDCTEGQYYESSTTASGCDFVDVGAAL